MNSAIMPIPTRSWLANVVTLCRRDLRETLGSRWFVLYTLVFCGLGLGVSYISASSLGGGGLAGFGRTSAGLINLVLLVVPLMSLSAGAGSIAGDRERGMLAYLLAQPVTRWEVLAGRFAALALTLVTSVCLGFGLCALTMGLMGVTRDPGSFLMLAGLTIALAMSMLSVGMLISVLARRTNLATGVAIFIWLILVLLSDLGLMAGAMTLDLPIEQMFALAILNPLQVFKMWSLQGVEVSLDVLGPAGLYAQVTWGGTLNWIFSVILLIWTLLPLVLAGYIFNRRSAT